MVLIKGSMNEYPCSKCNKYYKSPVVELSTKICSSCKSLDECKIDKNAVEMEIER